MDSWAEESDQTATMEILLEEMAVLLIVKKKLVILVEMEVELLLLTVSTPEFPSLSHKEV